MTRSISLLGSTGSIGRQTLQVARELGLSVAALTANRQVDLLEQQAREFHPALAGLYDRDAARQLRLRLSDTDIRVDAFLTTVDCEYPSFHLTMHCYLCSVVSGSLVLKEHENAAWLKREELESVAWLPADVKVVEEIKRQSASSSRVFIQD